MDKDCDKNDVTSRIPRIDRILAAPAQGSSRIPQPNIGKCSTTSKSSQLTKPGELKLAKASKLNRIPSLRTNSTVARSNSSSAVPKSIPKSHSNGAISKQNVGLRPPQRVSSKDAIVPDLESLMPNQQAIEDEVLSLVGSTDCLISAATTPIGMDMMENNGTMIVNKLETTMIVDKTTKILREPGKMKGSKIITKSKVCDKRIDQKSTPIIATPIRKGTFIADTPGTVTMDKTTSQAATIVLLRRDNTFDILDEKPLQGYSNSKTLETPVFKSSTSQRIRPKMLLLDASAVAPSHFDSPLQFNLEKCVASTPLDVGGANKNLTHDVLPIENTFVLDHTPKNITQVIGSGKPCEDMQVDNPTMAATHLIHLNDTTNLINLTTNRTNETSSQQEREIKFMGGTALKPRDSLGLLTPQQIERLEKSFGSQSATQLSSLIKFDDSFGDKTLVPDCTMAKVLAQEPIDQGPVVVANGHVEPTQLQTNLTKVGNRLSFSKFPDVSLSCSIDLEDITNPIKPIATPSRTDSNSFEMEDSLGILTPDQMKDFGDTTASRPSLDLMLIGPGSSPLNLRVEQTPSPEELPLDPPLPSLLCVMTQSDKKFSDLEKSEFSEMTESKTDVMKSSSHSKGSNLESVITSVTSITSLDGCQGDGEMSRPASRNAEYKVQGSPGGLGPQLIPVPARHLAKRADVKYNDDVAEAPVVRRPDPMTDSDFFTESDADDIFLRGDRRAQIIDGQLYGKLLQNVLVPSAAAVPPPNIMENSGDMESSGIFTDAEPQLQFDMSPDDRSTETVQSNSTGNSQRMSQRRSDSSNHHPENGSMNAIRNDKQHGMDGPMEIERPGDATNQMLVTEFNPVDKSGSRCEGSFRCSDKMQVDDNTRDTLASEYRPMGLTVGVGGGGGVTTVVEPSPQSNRVVNNKPSAAKRMNPTSRRSNSNSPPIPKKKMVEQPNNPAPMTPSAKVQVQKTVMSAKKTPNKWDAVMNKIAQNQSVASPKNYSDVKSRVNSAPKNRSVSSVGVGGGESDTEHVVVKSHSTISNGHTTSNRSSPSSKRPENSSTKRGRSTSKDSRKSSQSDLSVTGYSPKTASAQKKPQTIIRSAKKRDVRTINSSDLGPPYKTTTASILLTTTNNLQHNANTPNSQNGVSPKVLSGALPPATQFNNRVPASIQKPKPNGIQNQPPVPDNNNNKGGSLTTTPVKANGKRIRNGESPVSVAKFPLKEHNRLATPPASTGPGAHQSHPRSITGTPPTNSPKPQHRGPVEQSAEKKLLDAILLLSKNKFDVLDEAQVALRHKNDTEKEVRISDMEQELQVQSRGVLALGVLVNYLVHDYDAFSNPALKRNYEITSEKLMATRQHLEETCDSFRELEHRMADQESKFQTQSNNLANVEQNYAMVKEQLCQMELERNHLTEELELSRKQHLATQEENRLRTEELEFRLRDLTTTENELREKVMASEVDYSDRLKAGNQREKELLDRIQKLEEDFELMQIQRQTRETELTTKLDLMQKETVVLRSTSWNGDNHLPPPPSSANGHPYRHSSPMKSTESNLTVEVESLRSVLELKMNEVVDLRRQNQDLQRAADDMAALQFKTNSLESKVEDLQFQLSGRTEREGELSKEVKTLAEKLSKEQKYRTRLSIHNEELQWKLKQNSERHQRTLQELSKSFHENSMYQRSEDGFDMEDNNEMSPQVSPSASPKIKGIVETSDAVSWILEMDDDSPSQVASRAIRRVGSFRASPNALKRSKSSQSPINPLSQSASATSLLRQCSAETSPMKPCDSNSNARSRSKSMSVKPSVDRSRKLATLAVGSPMKKGGPELLDTSFQVPSYASSPYKQQESNGPDANDTFVAEEKKKAVSKNLSFSRTRAASLGAAGSTSEGKATPTRVKDRSTKLTVAKESYPLESAGEAMMLNISDGEDGILSANSSLTTSTSSSASTSMDDETAEKERTAISLHPSMDIKWSPSCLMGVESMEEEEDCDVDPDEDDIFGNSESVV